MRKLMLTRLLLVAFGLLMLALALFGQSTTLTFDSPRPPGSPGARMPASYGGISWPQTVNQGWSWEGAWSVDPTAHVYFDSPSGTARSLALTPPQVFVSVRVFGVRTGTLTITDDAGQRVVFGVAQTSTSYTVVTGWANTSSALTFNYTGGWDLGFDDFVLLPGGGPANAVRGVSETLRVADSVTCSKPGGAPCAIVEKLVTVAVASVVPNRGRSLVEQLPVTDVTSSDFTRQVITTLTFPPGGTLRVVGDSVVWTASGRGGEQLVILFAVSPDGSAVSTPDVKVVTPP